MTSGIRKGCVYNLMSEATCERGSFRCDRKHRPSAPAVKVSGTCELFATFQMQCPLCRLTIPANTQHRCEGGTPR